MTTQSQLDYEEERAWDEGWPSPASQTRSMDRIAAAPHLPLRPSRPAQAFWDVVLLLPCNVGDVVEFADYASGVPAFVAPLYGAAVMEWDHATDWARDFAPGALWGMA